MPKPVDYYEFLQISPNADQETIHRVYHFLATRFHPDNPNSGDAEKFNVLKEAYDVLSNPSRRAKYDLAREEEAPQYVPLSSTIDFMDQMEGELNRRLGLMALLYFRRRTNPWAPGVPLAEVEKRMGFPRDYLDFTTWYLERKGYISKADNSDFTLTADGVDFVEAQRGQIPVLNKLLTATAGPTTNGLDDENGHIENQQTYILPQGPPLLERRVRTNDRRANKRDRGQDTHDRRTTAVERRGGVVNRRVEPTQDEADAKSGPVN